jgi:subtilase family domain protein
MKHFLLTLLFGGVALGAIAQGKVNPEGMMMLHQRELQKTAAINDCDRRTLDVEIPQTVNTLILLAPGADADFLNDFGLTPEVVLDNVLVVNMPIGMVESVAQRDEVQSLEFGRTQSPAMNYARPAGNVDQVQNGFTYGGKSYSFDGTGVITGLMDTGLDPNHANFCDTKGDLRVKRVWDFYGANGASRAYTTPTAIAGFSTDDVSQTHGTHVAGIMAGSYTGAGNWVRQSSATSKTGFSSMSNAMPYKGVAPGSEIAMSGSAMLTDANIINGVSNIVTFAEAENKPCVVNMSLGSNTGPHDGTTAYDKALASLGKRAILCVSAGNEGDENMFVSKRFTASSPQLKTFIAGNTANQGVTDIWSSDNKVLKVSWVIYDSRAKTTTTILSSTASSSGSTSIVGNSSSYIQNADFNASFSGYVSLSSNVATYNNRYNVYATVNVEPKSGNATKFLGIIIEGTAGQTAYVYGTRCTYDSRRVSGWTVGNAAGSINSAAAADNVISVGSYNTRLTWGVLNIGYYGYYPSDYMLDDISPFSSYGKTFQGVQKPDVCAPGCGIVSSISTPYVEANAAAIGINNLCASATAYGRNNYWDNMQGTSMSCPYFSGVVALWLQADPKLTFSDIMEVVDKTCVKDIVVTAGGNNERWGAGKVDALAGIKYVLERKTAISGVDADNDAAVIVTPVDGGYELFAAGAQSIDAAIYSINGMKAADCHISGSQGVIATDGLSKGVYILTVDTPMGRHTSKVTVK